jgi:type III pantothenate kinase
MNLIFDIGNTSTKMAVYEDMEKIVSFHTRELSCEMVEKKMAPFKIKKAILSSVKVIPEFIIDLLSINIPFVHILSYKSLLPFRIEYETPESLGTDRIAAAAGACILFPDNHVLIIDAGSAITYDFLFPGSYKGGNISPGLKMRFRALHKFTGKLPLVNFDGNFSSPGRNTTDAIKAGVINGLTYEINEYIRTFEKKHVDVKVILTGGDSEYLKGKIGHKITYLPDIVIDGLNFILEYNAK